MPVNSLSDFKEKYGSKGWQLAMQEFIARSPEFAGKESLAELIREVMADLESALQASK